MDLPIFLLVLGVVLGVLAPTITTWLDGWTGLEAACQVTAYDRAVRAAASHERSADYATAALRHEDAARRADRVSAVALVPGLWLARAEGHRQSAARLRALHAPSTIAMVPASAGNAQGW